MEFSEEQVKAVLSATSADRKNLTKPITDVTQNFIAGTIVAARYADFLQANIDSLMISMAFCELNQLPKTPYYSILFTLRYLSTKVPARLGKIMQLPALSAALSFNCEKANLRPVQIINQRQYQQDIQNLKAIISFYVLCYLEQTKGDLKFFKKNESYALTLLNHLDDFEKEITEQNIQLSYLYILLYRTLSYAKRNNSKRLLLQLHLAAAALEAYVKNMSRHTIVLPDQKQLHPVAAEQPHVSETEF